MNKKFLRLFGSARKQDQIPLIEKGFLELDDWEFASPESGMFCDLLYSNDPGGYDEMFDYQEKFGGKVICNVLDIPEHIISTVDLPGLKAKLLRADAITAISKTTQNQVKKFLDLPSEIIFNPAKEIFEVPGIYQKSEKLKFLNCSRRSDPNKRYHIIAELMQKYYSTDQLVNVGSDPFYVGKFAGLVDNKYLNSFYNHCDYMLVATKNGGIELQIPESLMCGKKLVVAPDCECATEFAPEFAATEPTAKGFYEKILEIESNPEKYSEIIKFYQEKYSKQFHYQTITDNIIEVFERIENFKKN